jgi:addiction module HigA family antidote
MKTTHINAFAETLRETLEEHTLDQRTIAEATGIPAPHLSAMKTGTRRVTPEYDLRLSRYFGTSEGFWLRLQLASDLRRVRAEKGSEIKRQIKPAKLPLAV